MKYSDGWKLTEIRQFVFSNLKILLLRISIWKLELSSSNMMCVFSRTAELIWMIFKLAYFFIIIRVILQKFWFFRNKIMHFFKWLFWIFCGWNLLFLAYYYIFIVLVHQVLLLLFVQRIRRIYPTKWHPFHQFALYFYFSESSVRLVFFFFFKWGPILLILKIKTFMQIIEKNIIKNKLQKHF